MNLDLNFTTEPEKVTPLTVAGWKAARSSLDIWKNKWGYRIFGNRKLFSGKPKALVKDAWECG